MVVLPPVVAGFIVIKGMVDLGTVGEMNALLDADTLAQTPG